MIKYSKLEPSSYYDLVQVLKDIHTKTAYSHLEFSIPETIDSLTYAFIKPNRSRAFVAIDDGAIVGFALSIMRRVFCSSDLIAQEQFLWVDSEYQGKGVALVLANDFIGWANDNGARTKMFNASLGLDNDRAAAFFEKIGFCKIGLDYMECI